MEIWIGSIGVIGAALAAIGGAVVAQHRTRGARRNLAANATEKTMESLAKDGMHVSDPVRLRAELFVFYYKTVVETESSLSSWLLGVQPEDVVRQHYPRSLQGSFPSKEVLSGDEV